MWRIWTSSAAASLLALASPATAHPSRGIVVLGDGTVIFSDLTRIRAISTKGKMRTVRMNVAGGHTHALSLARDGSIWGDLSTYDPKDGRYAEAIWRMLPDGSLTFRYGPRKGIERGAGLIRDAAGCTWHHDQARPDGPPLVHRKCPGRPAALLYGKAGDDRGFVPVLVNDLGGSALAGDGGFVFRHHGVLRKVMPDGLVRILAHGLSKDNFGIANGPGGGFLVAEHDKRRVTLVDARGKRRTLATSAAPWAPTGVASRFGALYVLEASDHLAGQTDRMRVRRIAPDGRDTVLATATLGRS